MSRTESAALNSRFPSAMRETDGEVTVLLPVFNGARYLKEQIDSILSQDHSSLLLYALDDGSTDESWEILQTYAARDQRVYVRRRADNCGLMSALTVLLGAVRTPFFALSDQDDIWAPDKLGRSLRQLQNAGADLAYSNVRICDGSGKLVEADYLKSNGIRPVTGHNALPFALRNPAIGHTMVGRVEVAAAAVPVPSDLAFHEAWIAACACVGRGITYVDAQLGDYRQHASNAVGAAAPKGFGRASRTKTKNRLLVNRDRARRLSVMAQASVIPELAPVARLYDRSGWGRLSSGPKFGRTIWRLAASEIGGRAILNETASYVVAGLVSTGQRRVPDVD